MVDEATQRCENLACLCEVTFEEATCSPYCASPDGKDALNVRCACAHPACTEQVERQLHGQAAKESIS
jgi:hypothetical protein